MNTSAAALGLVLSFSLATACMAAEAGAKEVTPLKRVIRINTGNDFIEAFDTDGDGKVSQAEFEAEWDGRMDADFADFDADEDGFISEEEFEDEIEARVEKIMKRVSVKVGRALGRMEKSFDFDFDFDFDGTEFELDIEEAIERAMRHAERGLRHAERGWRHAERRMRFSHHRHQRLLEEFDENGDGELDPEELEKIRQAHKEMIEARKQEMEEHKAEMEKHRAEMKERHKEYAEKMKERRAEVLAELDEDGNGKISREEFNKRYDERFEKLDTNGDGELSEDELEAARWAFGRGWHPRVVIKTKEKGS